LPQHPKAELEAIQYMNERDAVYEKIKPYARKLKVGTKDENQSTVVRQLVRILDTQEVKDNVRRFLPALISQWETNDDELGIRLQIMDEVWEAKERYPYMAKVVNYFTNIPLRCLLWQGSRIGGIKIPNLSLYKDCERGQHAHRDDV
jgi:hypothetical protein